MLAEVHAAAVATLTLHADNKLLAKQLRLQRNQAFETAKSMLLRAHSQACSTGCASSGPGTDHYGGS